LNGSVRPSDWLEEVGNDHLEPESSSNSARLLYQRLVCCPLRTIDALLPDMCWRDRLLQAQVVAVPPRHQTSHLAYPFNICASGAGRFFCQVPFGVAVILPESRRLQVKATFGGPLVFQALFLWDVPIPLLKKFRG
jgi:hypothetical protein